MLMALRLKLVECPMFHAYLPLMGMGGRHSRTGMCNQTVLVVNLGLMDMGNLMAIAVNLFPMGTHNLSPMAMATNTLPTVMGNLNPMDIAANMRPTVMGNLSPMAMAASMLQMVMRNLNPMVLAASTLLMGMGNLCPMAIAANTPPTDMGNPNLMGMAANMRPMGMGNLNPMAMEVATPSRIVLEEVHYPSQTAFRVEARHSLAATFSADDPGEFQVNK